MALVWMISQIMQRHDYYFSEQSDLQKVLTRCDVNSLLQVNQSFYPDQPWQLYACECKRAVHLHRAPPTHSSDWLWFVIDFVLCFSLKCITLQMVVTRCYDFILSDKTVDKHIIRGTWVISKLKKRYIFC